MCIYIYAVLPDGVDVARLQTYFPKSDLSLRPALGDEFTGLPGNRFFTCSGFCDCGTVLGSAYSRLDLQTAVTQLVEHTARLQRKGWSQTKIDRWIADRSANDVKQQLPKTAEIDKWLRVIPTMLNHGELPWLGLFYHNYNTEAPTEIRRVEQVGVDELSSELLLGMEPDVLYRVRLTSEMTGV